MKKIIILMIFLLLINGCVLSPEKIIKNPEKVARKCDKFEDVNEKNKCFNDYAKYVSLSSKETSITICNNLAAGYNKNKCLFEVFVELEKNNRLNEGIEVCKYIEKEGFLKWCEGRRSRESIAVAPALA